METGIYSHLHRSSEGGSEEEEGPERAEAELYHEPGDDVELLHGVDEVHHQQHRAHPEPGHRHEHEPLAHRLLLVVGRGDHHTHKPQQVRQLIRQHCVLSKYFSRLFILTITTDLIAPGRVLT